MFAILLATASLALAPSLPTLGTAKLLLHIIVQMKKESHMHG